MNQCKQCGSTELHLKIPESIFCSAGCGYRFFKLFEEVGYERGRSDERKRCICRDECQAEEHDYDPIELDQIECSVHGVQPTACFACCAEAHRDGRSDATRQIIKWLRGTSMLRDYRSTIKAQIADKLERGEHTNTGADE